MPRRRRLSAAVCRQLTERDTQRCAYCRSPMIVGIPMVIEPIIPLVSGGSSTPANLCLACDRCNEFKGSRTEADGPIDGKLTVFLHPRLQHWPEHFAWREYGPHDVNPSIVWSHNHRGVAPEQRLDCASTPALDANWAAPTPRILSATSLSLYLLVWEDTNGPTGVAHLGRCLGIWID
jgi:hypothetical protein